MANIIANIENMKTGEMVMVDGYAVSALEMKNGKRCYQVGSNCNQPRSAKQVLTLISWDKKQCKRFGGGR